MEYQINDLEALTGIKAHTLRIWEKRYNLIAPFRTNTNIRYYNDEQVQYLIKVAALINSGKKISRVAQLNNEQLSEQIRALQLSEIADVAQQSYVTALTSAMIAFDAANFERLISETIERYGAKDAMLRVVYPFLVKVGVMWSTNEVMPAQEHFASCIIRNKLIAEISELPAPYKNDKTFLLFLPPNEWHEIGLLLTAYLVRNAGYHCIYLGQNVPFENVVHTQNAVHATHLVSFYLSAKKKMSLPDEFVKLSKAIGNSTMIICGRNEMLNEIPAGKSISHCEHVEEMVAYLNS